MPLDKMTVINRAAMSLIDTDQNRTDDLEVALTMALDDLSMRLKSQAFLTTYEETIATNTRTHTLTGEFNELKRIFALKLGDDIEQRVLSYVNPQQFLNNLDAPDSVSTTAGNPNKYTILVSDDGHPIIKFNTPTAKSETLTVYHFVELTVNNLAASRSSAALVAGTIAYFCGIATHAINNPDGSLKRPSGAGYYVRFKELAALARASDTFTPEVTREFVLSEQDHIIRRTFKGIQRGRR